MASSDQWAVSKCVIFRLRKFKIRYASSVGFPGGTSGKEPACQYVDVRDMSSIPGLGRPPAKEHGNPLQYSCLENPMDRRAWGATVHRVTKSQT